MSCPNPQTPNENISNRVRGTPFVPHVCPCELPVEPPTRSHDTSSEGKRMLRSRLHDPHSTQSFSATTPSQRTMLNSNIGYRLRLGYADGLAGHEAAVDHEQNDGRMELES